MPRLSREELDNELYRIVAKGIDIVKNGGSEEELLESYTELSALENDLAEHGIQMFEDVK